MGYRKAKSDLAFIEEYKVNALRYLEAQHNFEAGTNNFDNWLVRRERDELIRRVEQNAQSYHELRERIVKDTPSGRPHCELSRGLNNDYTVPSSSISK